MKRGYLHPIAAVMIFTAQEIRTDLITASVGNGISDTWNEFLEGENTV